MDVDLDKFIRVLRCGASDDLIAETSDFVFHSLFYGSQCSRFRKGLKYELQG